MCLNLGESNVNERVSERCVLEEPRVQSLLTFGFSRFFVSSLT